MRIHIFSGWGELNMCSHMVCIDKHESDNRVFRCIYMIEASKLRMSARILPEGGEGYDRMEMGVIRMKSLNKIHELLHECQGWRGETQLNRQILVSEGPWTGEDL